MQHMSLAHFAEDPKPKFPFLCLTVSGGHTQICGGKGLFGDGSNWQDHR